MYWACSANIMKYQLLKCLSFNWQSFMSFFLLLFPTNFFFCPVSPLNLLEIKHLRIILKSIIPSFCYSCFLMCVSVNVHVYITTCKQSICLAEKHSVQLVRWFLFCFFFLLLHSSSLSFNGKVCIRKLKATRIIGRATIWTFSDAQENTYFLLSCRHFVSR